MEKKQTIKELKKNASKAAAALGRIGGRVTAQRGKAYMRKIAKRGSQKRWANAKKNDLHNKRD